ncbi:hypothetical protein GO013_06390 [Pseudodesulfovibrio sp. JC047]|uniref:hypothetical protein n=1 Tax=Pseudodesulfovibrio sp. JC047 TaxID=2683199 RepID=UPI0013D28AC0|nr:hypothetical protein [Pseudodesulfovibrio sp. JC047]NDV19047.1 hypothetical protein [Pseudodesulfovibrio sp. JC047]
MPAISMFIMGLTLYYSMVIAAKFNVFDYSKWSIKVYGRTGAIMAPAYEILFNGVLVLATAVAFATGGSTLEKAIGTPYLLNTVVIAGVIFVLTIYGSALVRKAATVISLILIACIFIIYLPNIIYFFPKILHNFAALKSGAFDTGVHSSFVDTLWWGVKYGALQCCAVGAYIVHTKVCPDKSCLKKAAILGFLINTGIMYLTYFGIMAFLDEGVLKEAVPSLFVVMNGVGGTWMTVLITVCIVVGAVSTGVALVYGTTNRLTNFFGRNLDEAKRAEKRGFHSIIASIILVVICWLVAQLGLIPLIGKGYGSLGWVSMLVVTVPVVLRGLGLWKFSTEK